LESVSRSLKEQVPVSPVTHSLLRHHRSGGVDDFDLDGPLRELGVDDRGHEIGHVADNTVDHRLVLLRRCNRWGPHEEANENRDTH